MDNSIESGRIENGGYKTTTPCHVNFNTNINNKMLDRKFIYNNKIGFKLLPSIFCFHSNYIVRDNYNITIRGFIFYDRKLIYIRINPNTEELFNLNLKNCLKYLRKEYPRYKIYDSYKINKVPENMRYLIK